MAWANHGSTDALPSPDGRHIAFVRDRDLWLMDVSDTSSLRLIDLGEPPTEEWGAIQVLVTQWSHDSRRILFYVAEGELEDPEGEHPDRRSRPVQYGFHIIELSTRMITPVELVGDFIAWLPDGTFVTTEPATPRTNSTLLHYEPVSGRAEEMLPFRGWFGRASVAADGFAFAIAVGRRPGTELGSQVFRVDLAASSVDSITPLGGWGEYGAPAISPSGAQVAYVWRADTVSHVVVDGAPVIQCGDRNFRCRLSWVDEDVLAVIDLKNDQLVILHVDEVRELGRIPLD
jgi:Tol biopolymer transport system component